MSTIFACLTPAGALAVASPTGPTQQVTLALTPPDRAALESLAHNKGIARSARTARAQALEPTATRHGAVRAAVARLGLRVVTETPWTVQVAGSAEAVRAAFGSARAVDPADHFGHALPGHPSELTGLVTAAFGGDETRPRYQSRAVQQPLTGADVRAAYQAPFGSTPTHPTTIATLQFEGWDHNDLANYAVARGLPDPVASGQYTAVPVGHPETRLVADGTFPGFAGFEVALDQEALLGTAPNARQRAYFADNSGQGELDAMARIHQDATNSAQAGYGLVALSISWGICEQNAFAPGDAAGLQAFRDAYATVLADGVTIFTSSGDSGAFDCSRSTSADNTPAVDTPSSFPEAVAVGGTTLHTFGTLAPSDDTETVWASPQSNPSGYRGDGGGGGVSTLIARPSWQTVSVGPDASHRLVPDISANADPNTGYGLYYNDGAGNSDYVAGGTSLAAPLSAAMFTDTLIERGISVGIGDIHQLLYTAPSATFRDITTADVSFGFLSGYAAGAGYDLSSGLGSPNWTAFGNLLISSVGVSAAPFTNGPSVAVTVTPPSGPTVTSWKTGTSAPSCDASGSATAPTSIPLSGPDGPKTVYVLAYSASGCAVGRATTLLDTHAPSLGTTARLTSATAANLTMTWSATDPAPASGIATYDVTISHSVPGAAPVTDWVNHSTTSTSHPIVGLQGRSYTLSVAAYDKAGNRSARIIRRVDVPLDSSRFSYSSGWSEQFNSTNFGGSAYRATAKAASAQVKSSFRSLTAWFVFSSYGGRVQILVDGRLIKTVDTYSSTGTRYRVAVPIIAYSSTGNHTVRVWVTGTKQTASRSTQVLLDAIVPASY